jgi:hypothetical protein
MRRDIMAVEVLQEDDCADPALIPLRSPLSFHHLLHFSTLAIPWDVGLDFLGS